MAMSTGERPLTLLNPYRLGDLELKNRVVLAPMTRSRAGAERMANSLMAKYYTQRASAGLLITEAMVVSRQGIGWPNTPGIYSDEQGRSWVQVVDAVHAAGAPIFLQLWHCGRASHSDFQDGGRLPVAPSAVRLEGDGIHTPLGKKDYETPRALTTEEIPGIIGDYREAARRARVVGFDGVEVHGANGYLIDQFLQSKTNRRGDRYGGGIENRCRFLEEVLEAVAGVWPARRIGVRLSPNGVFNDMGSADYRETFLHLAGRLDRLGLAYLHVVDGLAFGFHGLGAPMILNDFRRVFRGPLIGCCGYDRDTAEAAIAGGRADLIAFGRPYLGNPDLVERFAHGWPLNPLPDMKLWYAFDEKGYTDFPRYAEP